MKHRFFVCACMECRKPMIVKIDVLESERECCVDIKNAKLLKVFNDEDEAKNFVQYYKKSED